MADGGDAKSEIRIPKSEGTPKSEIRMDHWFILDCGECLDRSRQDEALAGKYLLYA